MNDRVTALVLNIIDYKENDLLLQTISEDKSFITLIAKGAKKISGKKHYNNLCVYEFIIDYKESKSIFTIHNSKLLNSYYEDNNLQLLSYKNVLVELTLKAKNEYEPKMYDNLTFSLSNININNQYLIGSLYISYLLKICGLRPNVDGCVVCGNKKVVGISNKHGGFLCAEHCEPNYEAKLDVLKKFRLINKADFDNYDAIKDTSFNQVDFDLIYEFYSRNNDIEIKSYKLYKDIFR